MFGLYCQRQFSLSCGFLTWSSKHKHIHMNIKKKEKFHTECPVKVENTILHILGWNDFMSWPGIAVQYLTVVAFRMGISIPEVLGVTLLYCSLRCGNNFNVTKKSQFWKKKKSQKKIKSRNIILYENLFPIWQQLRR